jgi:hypothetical protein
MCLKDLFCQVIDKQPYDVSELDFSEPSRKDLISHLTSTYMNDVDEINILNFSKDFLEELLDSDDLSIRVSAALSIINHAIPHLNLGLYV